jgi:hypothetical protein
MVSTVCRKEPAQDATLVISMLIESMAKLVIHTQQRIDLGRSSGRNRHNRLPAL